MPLFSVKPVPSISIVQESSAPLSKDQKAFNSLIKKIEARRARLTEWEAVQPLFRQKYASDLLPLQEKIMALQWQIAQALDLAHGRKDVTKGEKRKLAVLIVELAESALQYKDHAELKALFNKHSQSDFDAEESARLDEMKLMLEDVLGMDLGDDADMRSPEDILKRVESQFWAQHEDQQEQAAKRRKSAREEARARKLETEEKQLSQSIREVFRKLASALHPDREPDPTERQRKTALMQRANDAYEKGNLLQLLELQLELEHIDQAHLAAVGPQRLKHYIKILKGQLNELDMEILRVEEDLAVQFGLPPFEQRHPKDLMPLLQRDISSCKGEMRQLKVQLEVATDPRQLKAWLKTIPLRRETFRGLDGSY